MSNTKNFQRILVAAVFVLSLGACSVFQGSETSGQYVDDTTITSKVKESFVADSQISASQIHVETMQGVVQLSGFTPSAKSEARAVTLARQVNGVHSVKDNIVVQPASGN